MRLTGEHLLGTLANATNNAGVNNKCLKHWLGLSILGMKGTYQQSKTLVFYIKIWSENLHSTPKKSLFLKIFQKFSSTMVFVLIIKYLYKIVSRCYENNLKSCSISSWKAQLDMRHLKINHFNQITSSLLLPLKNLTLNSIKHLISE